MNNNYLLKQSIGTLFLSFVLPSVISEVFAGMQGIVDGIFVGNYISANAMSAINIASPFMQFVIGCTMVVSTGTVSYLGRSLGQGDYVKSQNSFKSSFIGLTFCVVLIGLFGFIFAEPIALFLGANDVLLNDTVTYIRVYSIFVPTTAYMLLFGFVDRLLGKPNLYLYATIACLFTNIVTDFVLIRIFHMHVGAAAFATGLAYLSGLLFTIGPVISRKDHINIFNGKFDLRIFGEIAYNGSSEGVGYLSTAMTIFLFNSAFMHFVGEAGIAAFAVMSYIGNFTALIMFGVSDGVVSIVSTNYGAKNYERVRKTFYLAATINLLAGIVCFILLVFFGRPIINIFLEHDPFIVDLAVNGSFFFAVSFLFVGFNILQSGFNTAIGNAFESLLISGSRGIIFNFIGIMLFPRFLKLMGVWITFPFAELMTTLICLIIMNRNKFLYFNRGNSRDLI